MNTARLQTLVDFLKTVPDERFDLRGWFQSKARDKYEVAENYEVEVLQKDCGFAACAVGWACAIPEFKAAGLEIGYDQPVYKGWTNWNAVQMFFDLDEGEAHYLFDQFNYSTSYNVRITPGQVIGRLEETIRKFRP